MPDDAPVLLIILITALGLLMLACLVLLLRLGKSKPESDQTETAVLQERLLGRENEISQLQQQLTELKSQLSQEQNSSQNLRERITQLDTTLDQERERHQEKLTLLQQAREQMTLEFKSLANEILEQKGKSFSESNQQQMQHLLKPLGDKIQAFEKRVEETYDKESKQRFALEKEIRTLLEINTRISVEADNLTKALKGESKTQGNWGEVILERVLEKSGLEKGREYDVQVSLKDEQGSRSQPDVIVHLPEGKDVIIDSKVSLKDYEAYFSTEEEGPKALHLKQHIQSVRNHIRDLSGKKYEHLEGIRTLDFVLMFLPVEPAFTLAIQQDESLFTEAFAKNIILVGPSTLLATLRTIQSIWRYEYQNRHALEIADSAGKLYDKFVGFCDDLDTIGERLSQTRKAWDDAHNKLASGRGNLVTNVQKLEKLGAKARKKLPQHLLDKADDTSDSDDDN